MSAPPRTALITGASAGIGRELARLFAADGHGVVLVARREARLQALARELQATHGVTALVLPADLGEPDVSATIAAACAERGAVIDILVNNAGFGTNGPFLDADPARETAMVDVNCRALVGLTAAFVPGMVARSYGRVLNIGSAAGFQAGPYMATYYATKAFVNHFTEALDVELRGTGVTATVSCPGATATEFGDVSGNGASRLFNMGGVASAEAVARHAYAAMHRGRRMAVHGAKQKLLLQTLRLSPRRLVHRLTEALNRSKG